MEQSQLLKNITGGGGKRFLFEKIFASEIFFLGGGEENVEETQLKVFPQQCLPMCLYKQHLLYMYPGWQRCLPPPLEKNLWYLRYICCGNKMILKRFRDMFCFSNKYCVCAQTGKHSGHNLSSFAGAFRIINPSHSVHLIGNNINLFLF